jgi:ATP-binding cassette subfamily B protein
MNTIVFLYRQLRGYRLVLVLSIVMAFAQVGVDILSAFPLKFILDKVVDHREPGWPWGPLIGRFDWLGTREGLRPSEAHTVLAVIAFAALLIVVLGAVGALVGYVQISAARSVGYHVTARLRRAAFDRLLRLSLDWHGRMRTGDLVQRLTGNVADLEKLIIDGLVDLLAGLLTLLGMVAVMAAFNWQFTLLAVFVVPAMFLIVWNYTRRIKTTTKLAARAAAKFADVATDDVRAIAEVKAFTLEERESRHFGRYVDGYRSLGLLAGRLEAEFQPLVALVLAVSTVTIVGVGALVATGHTFRLLFLVVPAGALTVGTLTVFLTYVKQLYQPMRNLSKLMYVATNAASAAERVEELLEAPQEEDEEEPPGDGASPTVVLASRRRGAVTYEGVVFGYLPGKAVIKGVDLRVEPGEKVALVGLSGSGKTTLVRLIPRFHVPWEGSVLIDGIDNRRYPLLDLRRNIAVVFQDSVLFEGTIRDNIAIGRPDASDREIVLAARRAQIHETIERLEGGYASMVAEQGRNLSSGERQRVAIARAILRDAPILILDEPTANLDAEAEAEVMRAVDTLIQGRTVITISHRLSSIGRVDRIVVMEGGRLVEEGDLATLREGHGPFARLYRQQFRYAPDGPAAADLAPAPAAVDELVSTTVRLGTGAHQAGDGAASGGAAVASEVGRELASLVHRERRPAAGPEPARRRVVGRRGGALAALLGLLVLAGVGAAHLGAGPRARPAPEPARRGAVAQATPTPGSPAAHMPEPVSEPLPSSAGAIRAIQLSPAAGPCSPGSPCAVRVDLRLAPTAAPQRLTWSFQVIDRCTGAVVDAPGVDFQTGYGWSSAYGTSDLQLPAGRALAVVAVTTSPSQTASAPMLVPAQASSCPG